MGCYERLQSMQIRQKKIYPEETCDNLLIVKEWMQILKKRIKDTKVKDQKRKKRRRKNIIGKK